MRKTALMSVACLLLASCGQSQDLGDMTASEAERVCLDRAKSVVPGHEVDVTVTHKNDRYWDVLFGADPPQNLARCTINAVNGDVLHFSHGYTRRAAKTALRGGLWENEE